MGTDDSTGLEKFGRELAAGAPLWSEAIHGRYLSVEELQSMASRLPWVIPRVFIMPPHEYVDAGKLDTTEHSQAFKALSEACAQHPKRWRAFFRGYKTRNSYLEIGEYRYWYSRSGAAKLMNRSYSESELENIRRGESDRAVRNWTGCPYAWIREYGLDCENLRRYCNLIVVDSNRSISDLRIVRYAAMVLRNDVGCWQRWQKIAEAEDWIASEHYRLLQGVEALRPSKATNSRQVSCSDEEMPLKAIWMWHKGMDAVRVATDLQCFSTAPRLEVERVFRLTLERHYLIQLNIPAVHERAS